MNNIVPFLMLTVPGLIAVSVHNKQLIKLTRENWQSVMWMYILYTFFINFTINVGWYLASPTRTVSYAPLFTEDGSYLFVSFITTYGITAVIMALVLPVLCTCFLSLIEFLKKRKSFKIGDDE